MSFVRRATLLLTLLLGLTIQSVAFGQSQAEDAVYIQSSDHLASDDRVVITGTVANKLPVDVLEIEVTVVFENDTEAVSITPTQIRYIQAGGSAPFRVSQSFSEMPTAYSAYVGAYILESDDPALLFELFWDAGDDIGLREAIMATIERLPGERAPEMAERFRAVERPDAVDNLIKDLILLPWLQAHPSTPTAAAILDVIPRYNTPDYEVAFRDMVASAAEGDTIIPLLNEAALEKQDLAELVGNALVAMGDAAVPALLQATADPEKAFLVEVVLERLDRATPETQLAVTLPDARLEIIAFYSQRYDPRLVRPLLEAAAFGEAERQAVSTVLAGWGTDATPQVAEGLNAPHPVSRQVAEELLRRDTTAAGPVVVTTLVAEGQDASGEFERDLEALSAFYTARRQQQAEAVLQQANAALDIQDCPAALAAFEQVAQIDVALVSVTRMAEGYACAGQTADAITLLSSHVQQNKSDIEARVMLVELIGQRSDEIMAEGDLAAAADYLKDAVGWLPEPPLQAKLADIYRQQGREARDAERYNEAVRFFRLSQELDTSDAATVELGRTTMAASAGFSAASLLALGLGAVFLFAYQRRGQEAPHGTR